MDELTAQFLSAFNDVEQHLRAVVDAPDHRPYGALVDAASRTVAAVELNRLRLKHLGRLRNMVVHEYRAHRPLVTPNAYAVAEACRLRDLVLRPPLLGEHFTTAVYTCRSVDPLQPVLRVMADHDYSQVPVYDAADRFTGLLNTEVIARWLAARFEEAGGVPSDATVEFVLRHGGADDRHRTLGVRDAASDALMALEAAVDAGRSLQAILITPDGRPTTRPVGILTIYDVPRLRSAVLVR